MTPEIAKAAMQFLARVQLQGAEVPAYNAVIQQLKEYAHLEKSAMVAKESYRKKRTA
jgi:hypothetical protein